MSKKILNLLLCLVLGVALLGGSLFRVSRDINIDLNKVDTITGKVIDAGTKTIRVSGIKRDSYFRVFYFHLKNSEEIFAVHREYEGYDDLDFKIQPGDTVKVYYRSSLREYNRNVYQVEKNGIVLEAYKNYNSKNSTGAAMQFMFGIILIAIGLIQYNNFNVWKFLNSLVR